MKIAEPMTLITDYVMGAFAAILAARLLVAGMAGDACAMQLWGGAFACTAVAALLGGSHHGFALVLPAAATRILWKGTLVATGIGSAALLSGAAVAGTSGAVRSTLLAIVIVKLAVYLWWMASHDDFIAVIGDYAIALGGAVAIGWLSTTGHMAAAVPWLTASVVVAAVAALIQALKLAPHPHFNHNDLFHVVQMGALYLLYRGGMLIGG